MMTFKTEHFNDIKRFDSIPTAANGSPFAAVAGEAFVKTSTDKVRKIPFEYVSDIDRLILVFVNKMLCVTTQILYSAFNTAGVEITADELRMELRRLKEAGFLSQYEFCSQSGLSASKVWRLSHRGAGFLIDAGLHPRKTEYLNGLDASRIKNYLAALQLAVRCNGYSLLDDNITVGEPCFIPNPQGKANKIFRPSVTIQTERETIFIEAPRSDVPTRDVLNKIRRMSEVFKSRNTRPNIPVKNPKLIIVCENNREIKKIINGIYNEYWTSPFPIFFTTDNAVYTTGTVYSYKPKTLLEKLFAC